MLIINKGRNKNTICLYLQQNTILLYIVGINIGFTHWHFTRFQFFYITYLLLVDLIIDYFNSYINRPN